jgi:uncharacterized protein (DUF4213/DUF364 family)
MTTYMNLAEISAYLIENKIDLQVRKYSFETSYQVVLIKEHEGTSIRISVSDTSIESGIMDAMSRLRRMIEKGSPEMLPPQLSYVPSTEDLLDDNIPF